MVFLIAGITRDFTYVTVSVLLLFLFLNLSCVGGARRGLLLLIPPFRMPLPFLFLAGLFRRLACLRRPGRGRFYFFYLRLLLVGVLGDCPQGLHRTFEAVLLKGRCPWGQRISETRTMALDLWPALDYALTALCTISSKSMDSRSCCSISTLMKGLRPSRK